MFDALQPVLQEPKGFQETQPSISPSSHHVDLHQHFLIERASILEATESRECHSVSADRQGGGGCMHNNVMYSPC